MVKRIIEQPFKMYVPSVPCKINVRCDGVMYSRQYESYAFRGKIVKQFNKLIAEKLPNKKLIKLFLLSNKKHKNINSFDWVSKELKLTKKIGRPKKKPLNSHIIKLKTLKKERIKSEKKENTKKKKLLEAKINKLIAKDIKKEEKIKKAIAVLKESLMQHQKKNQEKIKLIKKEMIK